MNTALQSLLTRGPVPRPQKAVLYGPEGIGKSTLAAAFPSPVFLDTESGTHHLDVVRFPEVKSWSDATQSVQQLASTAHEFKTLVIDTVDWLEKRLAEDICRRSNKSSIEDFGFGKGYVIVAEEFAAFLNSLDSLMRNKGMHVLLLAHATIKKFEQPDAAGSYDRYELKLSKQVGPLVKEWCDLLLFGNYFTRVAENESGRKRGVGGRERVLYTTHTAAWDAKNRHGLEEKLPFVFDALAPVFGKAPSPQVQAPAPLPAENSAPTPEALAEIFKGREARVKAFLVARGQLKEGGTWADLAADYVSRILGNLGGFFKAVDEFQPAGGAA
jgi:hypothetical protein